MSNTTRAARGDAGNNQPSKTILQYGVDTRLNGLVPQTNVDTVTLAAAIGAEGVLEVRNDTSQYLDIIGFRIGDDSGNNFPFLTYIEINHERQWTQNITGCGIHSAFLGVNGPYGTPTWWRDSNGPGRSGRTWGMRGVSPWEVIRCTFRNLSVNQPRIRAHFICRTKAPTFSQPVPDSWEGLQRAWQAWQSTYQAWNDEGRHGDEELYKRQGIWKFYPLWEANLPGALTNTAVAGFGAIRIAANGESGPLPLPFLSTKEGLVCIFSFLGHATGDFDFEFLGGGYQDTRDGFKFVSMQANTQWNAGRTNNNFYTEGVFSVPRPYNVEDPPQINIRDRSGAQNDVYLGLAGISIPRQTWGMGGGGR